MPKKTDIATTHLAVFAKTKSSDQLQCAIETLEAIDPSEMAPPPIGSLTRHEVTKVWLHVLSAIDESLDPHFNPDDVPSTSVIPPPSDGVIFPAGVDPKALRDPKARAEYETALNNNRAKADRYNLQTRLQRLNKLATEDVERFIKANYLSIPDDKKEIDALCEEARLNKDQKALILKNY